MGRKGEQLEQQSDYAEHQADAMLEAASSIAADLGDIRKAIEWGREAERLYHESAVLARQAAQAYRESE